MPRFTGDQILPHVNAQEEVTVIDGSLTVTGDVGEDARITLQSSPVAGLNRVSISDFGNVVSSFGNIVITGNGIISIGGNPHKLIVQGTVHARAKINCSGDVEFQGYLLNGVNVETYNGDIHTNDLDESVTLKTYSGNVSGSNVAKNSRIKSYSGNVSMGNVEENSCIESYSGNVSMGNVAENSRIESYSGNVSVGHVAAHAKIKSYSGDVSARSLHSSATMKTTSGQRYLDGARVRSPDRRGHHHNATRLGVSTFFSGGKSSSGGISIINGRVFINGAEQTTAAATAIPAPVPRPTGNSLSSDMQAYLKSFEGKESFPDACTRLNITLPNALCCAISHNAPKIPVTVSTNSTLYDWERLMHLTPNAEGLYTDPITSQKFTLGEIKSARPICSVIDGYLQEAADRTPSLSR